MSDIPDLSNYYLIHEAMRTGSARLAAAIADLDPADRHRARLLAWMCKGVAAELHAHHTIEDDLFFPALAERVPSFLDIEAALAEQHVRLDVVTGVLRAAIDDVSRGRAVDTNLEIARDRSAELAELLFDHLGTEDDDVLPLFARHFSAEEYHELDRQAIKRTGIRKMLFTVPWAVTTVDPADAQRLLAEGPGVIRAIWRLTRRSYAERASIALDRFVPALVPAVAR